ncbi:MAG: hydroxymethylbilane synthase [Gemmatimonadales bacterium]
MKLRIGTRGSALALAQSSDVAARLRAHGHDTELVIVSTTGDGVTDRAFADVGAFGVFVRELEVALLDGTIDAAVHSYKDVPSRMPLGLAIAAVPERIDAADVLLVRREALRSDRGALPVGTGASVGTSATRRRALLQDARPDLVPGLLRGNVPTRVRLLTDGKFDAIVLAAAGLARLARADAEHRFTLADDIVAVRLDPATFVPAPSQGAIAVQVRENDQAARAAVGALDDASCRRAVQAERAALHLADGGCTLPFGAWCSVAPNGVLTLTTALGLDDGSIARSAATGTDPHAVAAAAWDGLSREVRA